MAVMIGVSCTTCTTAMVPVPANAPGLAAVAVCSTCAVKTHVINHGELKAAQYAIRQQAIEAAWLTRTPAFFRTHDLINDPDTYTRISAAAAKHAPLIVYGHNAQKRSAILWCYATTLGTLAALPSPKVGGGNEADTLALATTADFKLIDSLKQDYLSSRYRAVILDGIGEARFLNESRRHEEYAILARTMNAHNQIPLFTVNFWAPNNLRTNPFRTHDLMKWVGANAAADFAAIFDRSPYLPLEVT